MNDNRIRLVQSMNNTEIQKLYRRLSQLQFKIKKFVLDKKGEAKSFEDQPNERARNSGRRERPKALQPEFT